MKTPAFSMNECERDIEKYCYYDGFVATVFGKQTLLFWEKCVKTGSMSCQLCGQFSNLGDVCRTFFRAP